jgi:hypothetical protein
MPRKNFGNPARPTAFGEPRAKQSQDDKPLTHQEPVRTASIDYGLWSHLSLRSRSGMELSQAWPLLTRLFPAQLIPARPFGLGWRFDEAPSGNASFLSKALRAGRFKPTREVAELYPICSNLSSAENKT